MRRDPLLCYALFSFVFFDPCSFLLGDRSPRQQQARGLRNYSGGEAQTVREHHPTPPSSNGVRTYEHVISAQSAKSH